MRRIRVTTLLRSPGGSVGEWRGTRLGRPKSLFTGHEASFYRCLGEGCGTGVSLRAAFQAVRCFSTWLASCDVFAGYLQLRLQVNECFGDTLGDSRPLDQ
jgi:hypothetical protein